VSCGQSLPFRLASSLFHFLEGSAEIAIVTLWTHPALGAGNHSNFSLRDFEELMGFACFPLHPDSIYAFLNVSDPRYPAIGQFYAVSGMNILWHPASLFAAYVVDFHGAPLYRVNLKKRGRVGFTDLKFTQLEYIHHESRVSQRGLPSSPAMQGPRKKHAGEKGKTH
jgi:hypothetical protein